jgi:hypothetical protein
MESGGAVGKNSNMDRLRLEEHESRGMCAFLIWRQSAPVFGSAKDYNENRSMRRGKQIIQ